MTRTAEPTQRRLAVEADLAVELDGRPVAVGSEGGALVVGFGSVREALRALRALPRPPGHGPAPAAAVLRASGLEAEVRVRGWTVARTGPSVRPSRLAHLLGLGPVRLYPGRVLRAALGRRR